MTREIAELDRGAAERGGSLSKGVPLDSGGVLRVAVPSKRLTLPSAIDHTAMDQAILQTAFEALGAQRVVAVAKRENTASLHVLEKLGFRNEGERNAWGALQLYYVCDRV